MTPLSFLKRKFRIGYSDAEAMALLYLANFGASNLTQISEECFLPVSSGLNAIQTLETRSLAKVVFTIRKREKYYGLTDEGEAAVKELLKK